ncbi:hypothetical protein [Bradyrhizobium canariense]|nr:hypothetical protein [Bradyrhizobium canariense]
MRKERETAASIAEILRDEAFLALPALHLQMIDNLGEREYSNR